MESPQPLSPEQLVDPLTRLGQLMERFARVDRAVLYSDLSPESDTDHTVTLALAACALAATYEPRLDVGRVAQFALVHDLVEAYAGDTPTLNIDARGLEQKSIIEAAALKRIEHEFGDSLPWLHQTVEAYEALQEPEARFVKIVDKIMPSITHLLNDGYTLRKNNIITSQAIDASVARVTDSLRPYLDENAFASELRDAFIEAVKQLFRKVVHIDQDN